MTANFEHDAGDARMVALRGEDGAWYELPIAALDLARVSDPGRLVDLRNQLAAAGASLADDTPVALLSPETLATYRMDAERAAALEAAVDVVGFSHFTWAGYVHGGDHREWKVFKVQPNPGGNGIGRTETLALAPPPSVRFPGGFPGVA
jgi:hypothetical protein